MTKKSLYIWYSPATDVTGKTLMEQLGASGGTTKPTGTPDTVLCWGAKTSEAVTLNNKKVLNHPNNIRTNRNKLQALDVMKGKKVAVAEYSTSWHDLVKKAADYPIIARTKYHQGGAGMWFCVNEQMVQQAISEGAQYFQKFIHIKDEYRLHVVGDEVIYAVKKKPRTNHKDAFKAHWGDHVKNFAGKKGHDLDEATLNLVLDRLARKMTGTVDMVTRSNTRGWTFSRVNNPPENLVSEAVKATKALGLDFSAVDCCVDVDGKAWIIECNSGPGLDGSTLKAWVAALKKLAAPAPAKKAAPKKVAAKAAAKTAKKVVGNKNELKVRLQAQADMMQKMVDAAGDNEDQLAAVENLWAKMGG